MSESLASVIIPVEEGCDTLGRCLDGVMQQDFGKTEVIVVCDARAGDAVALPPGSKEVRVIRETGPCSMARLVNEGMRAARGHVKVLLRPHCIPTDRGWLRAMVEPFREETVGVVVSGCSNAADAGLAQRLLDSVDACAGCQSRPALRGRPLVSHRCDAYRASLLADIGYFNEALPTPADAMDVSIRISDAGYGIVVSDVAAVACGVAPGQRSLGGALARALDYGRADALLDKAYDLHWLNAGLFSVTLISLLLPGVAALSLPVAVVLALAIFLWGWGISVQTPLLHWDFPVAPINAAAYGAVILAIRGAWWPALFGGTMHPAVIRQWCWVGAVVGSYLLILAWASARGAARACRVSRGALYALPIMVLGALWRLLAGVGYLHGALFGSHSRE